MLKMTGAPASDRVLIVGDTHGNTPFVLSVIELAEQHGCQKLLQTGDFGFWVHDPEGDVFLNKVQRYCERSGVTLFWIDGNHDAHTPLRRLLGGKRAPLHVRPNIVHLPRGARWSWGGRTFAALGGAHSIDYLSRTSEVDWWAEERISDQDVAAVVEGGAVEVLVTHEGPQGVPLPFGRTLKPTNEELARHSREQVRHAAYETRPRLLLHGHWHFRYSADLCWANGPSSAVEGFASDLEGRADACGVLSLTDLRIEAAAEGSRS